jgi:TPR repeat protein
MTARACVLVAIGWLALLGCEPRDSAAPRAEPPHVAEPAKPNAPTEEPSKPAPQPAAKDARCETAESCFERAERAQDPARAAPLYMRACELGNGQACHRLGVMHQAGKGVPRDDDKARELFGVGCRQDSAAACDALGH